MSDLPVICIPYMFMYSISYDHTFVLVNTVNKVYTYVNSREQDAYSLLNVLDDWH